MADKESYAFWLKDQEPQERGRLMVKSAKLIAELPAETYRRDRDLYNVRLYENNPIITLFNYAGNYYADASAMSLPVPEQSTNNRAKSAIDTLASQIFSTNQRARFKVTDGKWRQRRRAREMQNFCDGLVYEMKLHGLRQRAGRDATILESGAGVLVFTRKNGRAACVRALATEFSIDPWDGLVDGQPRTLYWRRPLPRDEVAAFFGGDEAEAKRREAVDKAIKGAKSVTVGGAPGDHIEVYESWHLPTKEGGDDGRHVIALDVADGTLVDEPYKKPFHEVVFFALEERFTTVWGLSLMTQARKLQCRINANDYRVEKARKLCHAGHLYVNRAAKMNRSTMTNEIGTVWDGIGDVAPQQITFQNVSAEWEAAIERDGQRIFENLGINLAASQGETNTGLNASAAAKREDTAKSDKRNSVRQQRWEQFHLDCVRVALSIVRDIVTSGEGEKSKETGGYRVAAPGQRGLTVSDWKSAAMDEKDYVLEIRPASPVPIEPAGLVAYGREMIDLQVWKPKQLAGYLQDLDADGRVNRQMAQERQLEKTFESLLYDDISAAMPDEFTNLALALELGTEFLAQGMEDEVPEKHLERIRRYLRRCKNMAAAAQQALQAAAAPPPGAAAAPVEAEAAMAGAPALAAV